MELFTIGHSNHSIKAFIQLLQKYNVTALADVRSHPYSRYLPHFNQSLLQNALLSENIRYVFLGQELGARSENPECYVNGKAVYEKIAATELFTEGIRRVLKGAKTYRIALMCAEKDPITCHRAVLVCQHLREYNSLEINHIKTNGILESHNELEERLLAKHELNQFTLVQAPIQLSLFGESPSKIQPNNLPSREECLKEAYRLQGDEIAYVDKKAGVYK